MRLIDADALIKKLEKCRFDGNTLLNRGQLERDIRTVRNAPTVEYPFYQEAYQTGYEEGKDERPQGEWILKATDYDAGGNIYECTNCHYCDVHAKHVEVPFCWYCGAKMKGGAEK